MQNKKQSAKLVTMEVTDCAAMRVVKSKVLQAVLDKILPNPIRFKSVWHIARGAGSLLHCWKAIPPSDAFVALGMVCTSSGNLIF